ncbi:MAG: SAM-dependent methyltransferase [Epsilonproteobacteria bacterium]|nr:MAG: SAM-dependent methyltransferase [Campylobacterota bacterium]
MHHLLPPTLTGDNPELRREEIRTYFHNVYDLFESVFDVLKDDTVFYRKSEPTRHPMIFYFGHTATFYVNKLILGKVIDRRINPEFESMFAIGVDEMSWDDLNANHYRWPEVEKVRTYREQVRKLVDDLITTLPLTLPITQESPWWIILMGIEHDNIHIETSSVLHRQMPLEFIKESPKFPICEVLGKAPENRMIDIASGKIELGKERDHHLYGWDNEYGHAVYDIQPFKAASYLTSNGEFMAFVNDGGYTNNTYWDKEGAKFLKIKKATHPVFWIPQQDGSYRYRTLSREIEMPLNWPVDVNALEAEAFCRWKSEKEGKNYRLPSEAEWYRLYEYSGIKDVPDFDDAKANINLRHFASSCPVDKFSFGDLYDVVGNVWQWTQTPIDGFQGFAPHPIYDDFSVPTFDGKHNLMKGGSWSSTGNALMKYSRYAFRRHFYQHAGFRYIEADSEEMHDEDVYESDALVAQYCEFQYGEEYFGVRNFAQKCAEFAIEYTKGTEQKFALDLGCATGRATFELARAFDHVTGVDFSARFIQVGVQMKQQGKIRYQRMEEGDLVSLQAHTLAELNLEDVQNNVTFWQGDACNLKSHFQGYDLVMATNLIDRLYEPILFLQDVHQRINEGGILILTSPYTWMEAYTAKALWLGGYTDESGREVHTFDTLQTILGEWFDLIDTVDIPFVIRETPRKFQHTISQMSVWKKR